MDDDSSIYANISTAGDTLARRCQTEQQQQQHQLATQLPQRPSEEMIIHPYNLIRARSSHSVTTGNAHSLSLSLFSTKCCLL